MAQRHWAVEMKANSVSRVTICNAALAMIGGNPISDLNDPTTEAQWCRNLYDQARRSLLRMHPWSCCVRRASLPRLSAAPEFGWAYQYPLPADFVRLVWLSGDDHSIEGGRVLSNRTPLELVYVYDNDAESTWDDLLIEAMGLKMAALLARPVSGSSADAQLREQQLQALLKRARAINAQERPTQELTYAASSLLEARR